VLWPKRLQARLLDGIVLPALSDHLSPARWPNDDSEAIGTNAFQASQQNPTEPENLPTPIDSVKEVKEKERKRVAQQTQPPLFPDPESDA